MNPAGVLGDFRMLSTPSAARPSPKTEHPAKPAAIKASEEIAKSQERTRKTRPRRFKATQGTARSRSQAHEKEAAAADARLREILTALPNLPHASVPIGT
jgi:seryl-tRNA synthetase